MNINPLSATAQQASGGQPSSLGLKNEFLEMMVAQIKNQDPLNPLDGTEYVGQLAQFSMVEGIEHMRKGQIEQADLLYSQQVLQSTNLIGKEVLVPANSVALEQDENLTGVVRLDGSSEAVQLTVKNLNGNVVASQDWQYQKAGDLAFEFDGLDEGSYVLEVQIKNGDAVTQTSPWLNRSVEKVMLPSSGGDIQLALAGLGTVSLFHVSEFSQAKAG